MLVYIISLFSGVLFGSGMILSDAVNPTKVINFLDFFGNWDPSLGLVIGGALIIFIPCYHFLIKHRSHSVNGTILQLTTNKTVDKELIIGTIIFGIGWGLAGICPGPAISSIAGGSTTTFIVSMSIGMIIADKLFNKTSPQ